MGLSKRGYGIHGTNEPNSIGKAASHGCIRMAKADLEEFFDLVAEGDTVELVGRRNEETAQLFGDGKAAPDAAAVQPVVTAKSEPAAGPLQAPAQTSAQAPASEANGSVPAAAQAQVQAAAQASAPAPAPATAAGSR
jgi:hypothetical protein